MRLTASDIVRAISQLPKNQDYNYVETSTRTKIIIDNIVQPEGPIYIKRYNPTQGRQTATRSSIPTNLIWRVANALHEGVPVNLDRALAGSYNVRSALEALLAHTPEFYFCYPGRIEAFLVKFHGGENGHNRSYPVDEPISTLDTSNRFGLVEPIIVSAAHGGNTNPARDIDEPLGAVLGSPKYAVVETEPFLLGQQSGAVGRSVDEPVPTVAGKGAIGKVDVEPYMVRLKNNQDASDIDDPLKTLTTKESYALAEPYIVKFYGSGEGAESIDDPLATVTAKDRFALCIPSIGIALDIRFRMLQPHELAAAMSFPPEYEFTGNREAKVKQIGNAVPLKTAKALCRSLLT